MQQESNGQNPNQEESQEIPQIQNQNDLIAQVLEQNRLLQEQINQLKSAPQGHDGMKVIESLVGKLTGSSDLNKVQAHGLTGYEMLERRTRQASGVSPTKVKGNRDSNYFLDEQEQHMVHVALRVDDWDKGKNKGITRVQKFYPNDFNRMSQTVADAGQKHRPENAFGQYDYIKVLHMPNPNEELLAKLEAKKVQSMDYDELLVKYEEVFGVEAPDMNISQLIEAINKR
jgi:hypothetical protein